MEYSKAICKKDFRSNNHNLINGQEYEYEHLKNGTIRVYEIVKEYYCSTNSGSWQEHKYDIIFSKERYYEHFLTIPEMRKIKLTKLNDKI